MTYVLDHVRKWRDKTMTGGGREKITWVKKLLFMVLNKKHCLNWPSEYCSFVAVKQIPAYAFQSTMSSKSSSLEVMKGGMKPD